MSVQGLPSCAHCGALLQTAVCTICGKSIDDPVEVDPTPPAPPGMSAEDRRRVIGLAVIVVVAVGGWVGVSAWLNRTTPEPTPRAMARPEPIETTTTSTIRVDGPSPILARPDTGGAVPALDPVGEGEVVASPWDGALPIDVVTGRPLANVDYEPGIDAVAARIRRAPAAVTLAAPTTGVVDGVDLAMAEASQPVAARSVTDPDGPLGDLWLIARGPARDDASAAYLARAAERWSTAAPIESFSPRPGLRVHRIADDGAFAVWASTRDDALLVWFTAAGVDPARIGAASDGW